MSYAIHEQCRRWMTSRRYYGRDQKEWDHDREDGDQHVDVDSDIAASDPRGNPIDLQR